MPLFRRSAADGPPAEAVSAPETAAEAPAKEGGKGRPTPKRRDVERQRRRPVTAPATRREAYRGRRGELREERRKMRRALASGDERNLPPRDAGPARRYARDVVDGRRNPGSAFLPGALLLLVISAIPNAVAAVAVTVFYLLLILGVVLDCARLSRRVKRDVAERFGPEHVRGVGMYAVQRSIQLRRLRMPPPKVARGEPPRR